MTLCRNDTLTLSDRERNLQDNALKFCAVWMEEEKIEFLFESNVLILLVMNKPKTSSFGLLYHEL